MIARLYPIDLERLVLHCVHVSSLVPLLASSPRSAIDNQGVFAKQIAVFSSADTEPTFSKVGILLATYKEPWDVIKTVQRDGSRTLVGAKHAAASCNE